MNMQEFVQKYPSCPLCLAPELISFGNYIACYGNTDFSEFTVSHYMIDCFEGILRIYYWFEDFSMSFHQTNLSNEWNVSFARNYKEQQLIKNISDQEFHSYMTDSIFLNNKIEKLKLLT